MPVVVVVENPQEDPDVYASPDVEVIELTTYPMSKWGEEEVLGYGEEYAVKIEYARNRFPIASRQWKSLNEMVQDFRARLIKAMAEEDDEA